MTADAMAFIITVIGAILVVWAMLRSDRKK